MMLGVSGLSGSAGDGATAEACEGGTDAGGGGGGPVSCGGTTTTSTANTGGCSEDDDKARIMNEEFGERNNSGGNRWPRQETLALLKIRSDMDVAFRDSSLKGPLWEEVSRKMEELGYHRSAQKCKEKFENVYKYHKRTRVGRAAKPDAKTYRFFDQLEALDSSFSLPPPPPPVSAATAITTTTTTGFEDAGSFSTMELANNLPSKIYPSPPIESQVTVPSAANPITCSISNSTISPSPIAMPMPNTAHSLPFHHHHPHVPPGSFMPNFSSSSTSSDEEPQKQPKSRKRKWKDFFQRLMKEVVEKQEKLQKKFLDTLERRERDRMIREEAWRVQEMARMNREHDLIIQERSMAAAKDAAVIAFLQKMTNQHNPQNLNPTTDATAAAAAAAVVPIMQVQVSQRSLSPILQQTPPTQPFPPPPPTKILEAEKMKTTENGGESFISTGSSSRWPKAEVQALINLRRNMDLKYQENGPKGPLWEEISVAMRKIGYNRSAKRCKEKWENINKYFKKVKESNKKRPEDSKTCPYFHQLDAIYKERAKIGISYGQAFAVEPDNNPMIPIMVRPEQQWPLASAPPGASEMDDQDHENNDDDDEDGDDEEDDDDDEEDDATGYEVVTNKPSSTTETAAD